MPYIEGELITGQFNRSENIFLLQKVKNFVLQTNLNEKLTNHLYTYLKVNEQDEDGLILTLYDQMPIMVTQNEVKQLVSDFEKVKALFQ